MSQYGPVTAGRKGEGCPSWRGFVWRNRGFGFPRRALFPAGNRPKWGRSDGFDCQRARGGRRAACPLVPLRAQHGMCSGNGGWSGTGDEGGTRRRGDWETRREGRDACPAVPLDGLPRRCPTQDRGHGRRRKAKGPKLQITRTNAGRASPDVENSCALRGFCRIAVQAFCRPFGAYFFWWLSYLGLAPTYLCPVGAEGGEWGAETSSHADLAMPRVIQAGTLTTTAARPTVASVEQAVCECLVAGAKTPLGSASPRLRGANKPPVPPCDVSRKTPIVSASQFEKTPDGQGVTRGSISCTYGGACRGSDRVADWCSGGAGWRRGGMPYGYP
jgi:hypothetical protein